MSAHSTAAKRIAQRHHNGYNAQERAHPLDGMSTAEFVRVARAGWPRVPVPADPLKAARKVAEKHAGTDVLSIMKYEEV
jgi:hypothetical protein